MKKIMWSLLIVQILFFVSSASADPYGYNYLEEGGTLLVDDISSAGASSNVTNFTDLLDTPNAYTGDGGDCVAVNAGETGLEFINCATGGGSNLDNVVFFNDTGSADLNITLGDRGWFFGLFDMFVSSIYLAMNGSTLTLDDDLLNTNLNQTDLILTVNTTNNIGALGAVINDTDGYTVNFTRIQSEAYQTDQGAMVFNLYDDGSEGFINATSVMDAFGIEVENSKLILFNEPTPGNDFKVLQIFSKEAQDTTEFVVTKAGDAHTSYFIRSLAIVGNETHIATPFNCTTYANYIDCRTDITGADFYVQDDVEINGTLYVNENIFVNKSLNISNKFFFDPLTKRASFLFPESTTVINGDTFGLGLVLHQENDTEIELGIHRHTNTSAIGAVVEYERSRGSEDDEEIVADGDNIGRISFLGYDGTDYARVAEIRINVNGTPGNNDMPGSIDLRTTADGAINPTTRLMIDSTGLVKIQENVTADFFIGDGSLLTNQIFAGRNTIGGTTLTAGTFIDIKFDTQDRINSFYTHNQTSDIVNITLNHDGDYRIQYDICYQWGIVFSSGTVSFDSQIMLNNVLLQGSGSHSISTQVGFDQDCLHGEFIRTFSSTDILRLQIRSTGLIVPKVFANSTRINMEFLS